jgi:P27 family predicted phage terminase small subunit
MAGRRPIPTHLKLLRGNPGKRALNKDEPNPEIADQAPPPPDFLDKTAADEWRRVALELHRLRLLTSVDLMTLAAYCDACARWRDAADALAVAAAADPETHGLLVRTKDDGLTANPLIWIGANAAKAMVRYATEFGMTPASRSKVSAAPDRGPSKFDGLLG